MKRKEYHAETETGLHNFRARMYLSYEMLTGWKAQPIPHWRSSFHRDDSFSKRFNAVDPMLQFASPFCYVGNNPVSFVDPTGMVSNYNPPPIFIPIDHTPGLDFFIYLDNDIVPKDMWDSIVSSGGVMWQDNSLEARWARVLINRANWIPFEGLLPGKGPKWHHEYRHNKQYGEEKPDNLPENLAEAIEQGWWLEGESPFHGGELGYKTFRKLGLGISGYQLTFTRDGDLVTDRRYYGTYDFCAPWTGPFHWVADVIPYIIWGN